MSVLVDWQLKERIDDGRLVVIPMMDDAIQPNSIDVRLGNSFATYNVTPIPIDPYDESSVKLGLIEITEKPITLFNRGFLLAETLENIQLPDNICATIEGKSSLARLGITVHQTGGWIDCGFCGTITLEMTNENARPVLLYPEMPIAQLVFYETESAQVPYNKRPHAKYRGQSGATGSQYFKNQKRR